MFSWSDFCGLTRCDIENRRIYNLEEIAKNLRLQSMQKSIFISILICRSAFRFIQIPDTKRQAKDNGK